MIPINSVHDVIWNLSANKNNIDWPPDLAQGNSSSGQMVQRYEGVFELFVAHQQLAESVERPWQASATHRCALALGIPRQRRSSLFDQLHARWTG